MKKSWAELAGILVVLLAVIDAQQITPRLSERNLRRDATAISVPRYPDEDVKAHKAGVAVAEIAVDEKGKVKAVRMLEAPSNTIAAAMSQALLEWKFAGGAINGNPSGIVGKVTYYFVFQHGKPVVLSPEDAPYLGPLPKDGK